jgi:serine protease Do
MKKKLFIVSSVVLSVLGSGPSALAQTTGPTSPKARSVSTVFTATTPSSTYVGVFLAEIDGERAKALKLRDEHGVEVTKVEEESPAAKAGLKVGDVLLDYNGQRVEGIEQFRRFVRETPAGRDVKMGVSRDGNQQFVVVKIGARKMMAGAIEPMIAMTAPRPGDLPEIRMPRGGMVFWSSSALGVEAEGLEGQLAQFFGVKEGVLVRSVSKGSAAEKAGLKAGDVIVKVDETSVSSPSELTRAVRTARNGSKKSFSVVVMREKKETSVTVPIDDEDRSEMPWPRQKFFELPAARIIRL